MEVRKMLGEEMRPQTNASDQDQIDPNEIVEDAGKKQNQDAEDQSDDRLDRDNVNSRNRLHENGSSWAP
jgi:hypothetical protein